MNSALVGTIIAALAGIGSSVLVYRNQRRSATTDAGQRQIDQIQEDREADRSQFERVSARFAERQTRLENRVENLEARDRVSSQYILDLRFHISEGQKPPPPPFPPELLKGMSGDR